MGACSSKPKTTEFEGSMAPSKQTEEAAADQPQAMERSLEIPVSEHGKERKLEEKDANATTKTVQSECELDVTKEEGPPAGSNLEVLGVKEAVKTEASDGVEKIGGGGGNEVVQEGDVGSAVADNSSVDDKTDMDSAVANKMGRDENGIKANLDETVVDETKTCEDKVVVLEETGTSQVDAPYVDKTVALNEEKPTENKTSSHAPDKRSLVVPEEDVSDVLDSTESRGVESPIAGLVQPLELMKHGDGGGTEPEKDRVDVVVDADAQDDFKLVHEGVPSDAGDEDVHTSAKAVDAGVDVDSSVALDLQRDVVEPPGGASSEVITGSGAEMLAPAEGDTLKDPDEAAFQLQVEAASDAVDSAIHSITDSQVAVEECPRDIEPNGPLDEIAISSVTHKGEGSVDDSEVEAPTIAEIIDSKTSTIEPNADDIAEESVQEVGGPVVQDKDVNVGQAQALVSEEPVEDGKPKDTLDQNTSEGERKSEEALAITSKGGKDAAQKPQLEHTTSVDATFEDASDVPLKVEAGKSTEEGSVSS